MGIDMTIEEYEDAVDAAMDILDKDDEMERLRLQKEADEEEKLRNLTPEQRKKRDEAISQLDEMSQRFNAEQEKGEMSQCDIEELVF